MAEYTRVLNTSFNFPNIDIFNILKDGVKTRFEAVPHEGYVMYDTNDEMTEPKIDTETGDFVKDPETGDVIEVPVTHYYTLAGFPLNYNFDNFSWKAVNANADSEEPDGN